MFKKRDPTEEELVEEMQKVGISTKSTNGRQEKFGAFKQYAQERLNMRPGLAPVNPYANMNSLQGNPYAQNDGGSQNSGDNGRSNSYGGNPYGSRPNGANLSPYSQVSGNTNTNTNANGYGAALRPAANPYGSANSRSRSSPSPYASSTRLQGSRGAYGAGAMAAGAMAGSAGGDEELILDLNAIPSRQAPVQVRKAQTRPTMDTDTLDLNDEDDLNVEVDDFIPEQEQVNSEDEEIEAIKQDIRFTKQESVALTRNTLRMAQEADASGTNTLGMLGSQLERLYNAEQNLLLADTQTKIAEDKVAELKRLNRSIFIPATGNPFNRKLRLHQQEMRLKTQKEQEKYLRETNRAGMYASEQRIKQGITSNATNSETFNKYQGEKHLQQAQRYQFDNDLEDDEMEKELASNLDQILNYTKKLRTTATTMGQEVDAQNARLRQIEEDADRLDINVHLNSTRLNNIR